MIDEPNMSTLYKYFPFHKTWTFYENSTQMLLYFSILIMRGCDYMIKTKNNIRYLYQSLVYTAFI